MSLHAADLILQLPARPFEGIVDGEGEVGMSLVGLCGAVDIDFAAVRQRQTNINFVETATAMMVAGRFQRHATRGYAAVTLPSSLTCCAIAVRTSELASMPWKSITSDACMASPHYYGNKICAFRSGAH